MKLSVSCNINSQVFWEGRHRTWLAYQCQAGLSVAKTALTCHYQPLVVRVVSGDAGDPRPSPLRLPAALPIFHQLPLADILPASGGKSFLVAGPGRTPVVGPLTLLSSPGR